MKRIGLVTLVIALVGCRDTASPPPRPFADIAQQCKSPELGCPRPIFGVANLRASIAYYRDVLGYKIDWEWGEPADFASVTRSGTTIFIDQSDHPGGGALWVFAKQVDKLHDELRKRNAVIKMPPTNMPWGSREMHILDKDGNLLRFAGPEKK